MLRENARRVKNLNRGNGIKSLLTDDLNRSNKRWHNQLVAQRR